MANGLSVLIVSDNSGWVSTFKKFLNLAKVEVATAKDIEEGINTIIQISPDLAILDTKLSLKNRTEFLEGIKKTRSIKPVVVLTIDTTSKFRTSSVSTELVCNDKELMNSITPGDPDLPIHDRIRIASHEITNPITALLLNFQLTQHYQNSKLGPGVGAASLISLASRIKKLTEFFFSTGYIAVGRINVNLKEEDLNQIVRDLVEQHEAAAKIAGVKLIFQCRETIIRPFDRQLIEQLVTNLLSNAIKYGRNGPVKIETSISNCDEAVITIRDRGEGISSEAIRQIFEFGGRDSRIAKKYDGKGLGLWMTQQIAKALGGYVLVSSEVEIGTHFSVHLPNPSKKLYLL